VRVENWLVRTDKPYITSRTRKDSPNDSPNVIGTFFGMSSLSVRQPNTATSHVIEVRLGQLRASRSQNWPDAHRKRREAKEDKLCER
jgi:hypothetical protein